MLMQIIGDSIAHVRAPKSDESSAGAALMVLWEDLHQRDLHLSETPEQFENVTIFVVARQVYALGSLSLEMAKDTRIYKIRFPINAMVDNCKSYKFETRLNKLYE